MCMCVYMKCVHVWGLRALCTGRQQCTEPAVAMRRAGCGEPLSVKLQLVNVVVAGF
jgi:hypothetical protein